MTQIKEFLRRGLFTVIVLCSAAACSNNDENEDTNYTLDSIQWAMLNDDKVEETVINIMPEIYENASSSTISVQSTRQWTMNNSLNFIMMIQNSFNL